MKKITAFILCITLICAAAFPAAYADETTYIEYNCRISTENIYYVRFNQNVSAVGDALHVEYIPAESGDASVLDAKAVTVYTGERVEIVLQFPESVSAFTIFDLVLKDETHAQQHVQREFVGEFYGLSDTWSTMKRDVFYAVPLIGNDEGDCYVAVGSEWELNFGKNTTPRDPYLRKYVSLTAEGIDLKQEGEKYVFQSVGDGKVSLCIFGIPKYTKNVHVREKSEVKKKMLFTIPVESFSIVLYTVRWLGPFAFVIALPIAAAYTIVTYLRLLFA